MFKATFVRVLSLVLLLACGLYINDGAALAAQPAGIVTTSVHPDEPPANCSSNIGTTLGTTSDNVHWNFRVTLVGMSEYLGSGYGLAYIVLRDDDNTEYGPYNVSGSGGLNVPVTAVSHSGDGVIVEVDVTNTANTFTICSGTHQELNEFQEVASRQLAYAA